MLIPSRLSSQFGSDAARRLQIERAEESTDSVEADKLMAVRMKLRETVTSWQGS
jgi:flavin-binding protein dodecin